MQVTKNEGLTSSESADGTVLYYKKPSTSAIFSVPVEGGVEASLGDEVDAEQLWTWIVTRRGIYLLDAYGESGPALEFFDFSTRRVMRITPLELATGGISISPDERWLAYTRLDQSGSDIVLVEHWR